ncbi:ras guanine nucleotide exchange factor i-related [Anaeramoeba ignava]|uniref:Ras guanine nucleotide exchange factor i-related n=1 Tax=Anaeramoeba ignava TaxID=1746090 RepID=A0A9Q0LGD8_ANAIG|nr:ras guanine nucleotide exchange factor i-related [Anaeramoeba ignava]
MELEIGSKYKFHQQFCTVRYKGETQFAPGNWIGIELAEPNGKSNGTIDGVKYFDCKPNHGLFVKESQIKPLHSDEDYRFFYSQLIDTNDSFIRNSIHTHSLLAEKISNEKDFKEKKIETLSSYLQDPTSIDQLENANQDIQSLNQDIEIFKKSLEKKSQSTLKSQELVDKLSKELDERNNRVQVQSDNELRNQIETLKQELEKEQKKRSELQKQNQQLQKDIISVHGQILKENDSLKSSLQRRDRKIRRVERSRMKILRGYSHFEVTDQTTQKSEKDKEEEEEDKEREKLKESKKNLKKKLKTLKQILEMEQSKNEQKVELGEILGVEDQKNHSLWVAKVLKKHTKILEYRERMRKKSGKVTFGRLKESSKTEVQEVLSKDVVDSLIIQYFNFYGRNEVANFISEETGVDLQFEFAQNETKIVELLKLGIIDMEHLWDERINENARFGEISDVEFNQDREKLGFELTFDDDVSIWDEPPDNNDNIRYNKELVEKLGGDPSKNFLNTISAANLNKLIEKLTYEKNADTQFIKAFLITFQNMITPERLLFKLIQRFRVPKPKEDEKLQEWNTKRAAIQAKVSEVIRLWIEQFYEEFEPKLISHLETFIDNYVVIENPQVAKKLKNAIKVQQLIQSGTISRKRKTTSKPPVEPKVPKNIFARDFGLSDLSVEEFARQTTLFVFEIYRKISPTELVTQAWSKAKLHHKAKNVLFLIKKFNEIVGYISTQILLPKKPKQRAKQMIRFIKIGEHFFQMHNYDCTMAVIAALTNASVSRLNITKEEVPEKYWKKYNQLETATSSDNGYKEYRALLKKTEPPGIPYLGVFLTDITFICDGSESKIDGLLNISMRKILFNTISEIQRFQQEDYPFQAVDQVQNLLNNTLPFKDENKLYKKSLKREPRK